MFAVYLRRAHSAEWLRLDSITELSDEEPFTSKAAYAARGGMSNLPHLESYLAQEAADPQLNRDAIELWASQAQAESADRDWLGVPRLVAHEEALALYDDRDWDPPTGGKPAVLAWHVWGGVFVTVPGDMRHERVELRFEFTPSRRERDRAERLRHRYASAEHELETILDWRAYSGRASAVFDGYSTMRRRGHGFVVSVLLTGPYVVANVLQRWVARGQSSPLKDSLARDRRRRMEDQHPAVASRCPELSTVPGAQHPRAMVFVHGTASCGILGLRDLVFPVPALAHLALKGPTYRFEHDTYEKISDNAEQLVKDISERLATPRLLLVAHSRGGLVAKLAAATLRRNHYPAQITVYTLGTPHTGTPLVGLGECALNMLLKLGEGLSELASIPALPFLVKGAIATAKLDKLPPGILAMSDKSELLLSWSLQMPAHHERAWAANFDIDSGESGFGSAESFLLGAFGERPNDLVVPTDSALAFGAAEPVLGCSHSHYFRQQAVLKAVHDYFAQPDA